MHTSIYIQIYIYTHHVHDNSIRQTNNNTARIPELVPGSFAILHVPAGGGMLLLPPAEDGFKATVSELFII